MSAIRQAGLGRFLFSLSLTFCRQFFFNSAGFVAYLLVSRRCVHMMFYRWHPLGLRAWLFTMLCISGTWETLLPGWGVLHPTRKSERRPSRMGLIAAMLPWHRASHRALRVPFTLTFVLILYQIDFSGVTPKIHWHTWELSQGWCTGLLTDWVSVVQIRKQKKQNSWIEVNLPNYHPWGEESAWENSTED